MKYKLVIFDFDGTLMDTSEGIYYCAKKTMAKCNQTIGPDARWDRFIGPPLTDCFKFAFGVEDPQVIKALCKTYREFYFDEGCQKAKFYPGILDLLKDLRANGILTGIASMKHDFLIEKMCRYFGFFDLIDCREGQKADEITDKSTLVKRMCEKYNLKPSDCVLIGDTIYDKEGAEQAGCDGILVNFGFGYKPGDPGTVSSVEEIRTLIFGK